MTEQQAFVATIRAYPNESTPRFAYADWLTEHDQPERAEFIRVSVALHALNAIHDPPSSQQLKHLMAWYAEAVKDKPDLERRRLALRDWQTAWAASHPLGPFVLWEAERLVRPPHPGLAFYLGLITSVSCTASQWFEHGRGIMDNDPVEIAFLHESLSLYDRLREEFPNLGILIVP